MNSNFPFPAVTIEDKLSANTLERDYMQRLSQYDILASTLESTYSRHLQPIASDLRDPLHAYYNAVRDDKIEVIDAILEKGVNVTHPEYKHISYLTIAVHQVSIPTIQKILSHPTLQKKSSKHALTLAVCMQNKEIVRMLMNHKLVDINEVAVNGNTPFITAIKNKDYDMITLLLNHRDLDVDRPSVNGVTPITTSIRYANDSITRLLIEETNCKMTLDNIKALVAYNDVNNYIDKIYNRMVETDDNYKLEFVCNCIKNQCITDDTIYKFAKGMDINTPDIYGDSILYYTISYDRDALLEMFEDRDFDFQVKNNVGMNILLNALSKSSMNRFAGRFLMERLETKPDDYIESVVNSTDSEGRNALQVAIINNHVYAVRKLAKYPFMDVNNQDTSGRTALIESIHSRENFELVLAHPNIDVNIRDENGESVFFRIITDNNMILDNTSQQGRFTSTEDVVYNLSLLTRHPTVDINQTDYSGDSILIAVVKQHSKKQTTGDSLSYSGIRLDGCEYAEFPKCMEQGITSVSNTNITRVINSILTLPNFDPNIANYEDETPLIYAIEHGDIKLFNALMSHKDIDVNGLTSKGTPINVALKKMVTTKPPELKKPEPTCYDFKPTNLTTYCVSKVPSHDLRQDEKPKLDDHTRKTNTHIVNRLLSHPNIDVNLVDYEGNSPLHVLDYNTTAFLVQRLIRAGINVNAQNVEGLTPLMLAVQHQSWNSCLELLKAKADMELTDTEGKTVVDMLADNKSFNIFKQMAKKLGLTVEKKTKSNTDPIDQAVIPTDQQIADLKEATIEKPKAGWLF